MLRVDAKQILYFQSVQSGILSIKHKQAEKLKSREMKEGWMKSDEGWMKNDERWRMNDAVWWFQAVEGFWFMTDGRTDERTNGHLWL